MRSNKTFLELSMSNGKRVLINKSAIVFVVKEEVSSSGEEGMHERAIIKVNEGSSILKVVTKDSYESIVNELLWEPGDAGFGINPIEVNMHV